MFCWVRGQCDLPAIEPAGAASRAAALQGTLVPDRAVGSDVCTRLHPVTLSLWQDEWDNAQGNKLHVVNSSEQE